MKDAITDAALTKQEEDTSTDTKLYRTQDAAKLAGIQGEIRNARRRFITLADRLNLKPADERRRDSGGGSLQKFWTLEQVQAVKAEHERTKTTRAITLDDRADKIRKLAAATAQNIIEIGRELIAAKSEVGHGNWANWLKDNFDWTQQTANNFMRIAEQFGDLDGVENFTPSQLQAMLPLKDEVTDFVNVQAEIGTPADKQQIDKLKAAVKQYKKRKKNPVPVTEPADDSEPVNDINTNDDKGKLKNDFQFEGDKPRNDAIFKGACTPCQDPAAQPVDTPVDKLKPKSAAVAALTAVSKLKFPREVYELKLREAQELTEQVALAKIELGKRINELPKVGHNQYTQVQIDTPVEKQKPKSEAIAELGLTQKQAERFQQMAQNPDAVQAAILRTLELAEEETADALIDSELDDTNAEAYEARRLEFVADMNKTFDEMIDSLLANVVHVEVLQHMRDYVIKRVDERLADFARAQKNKPAADTPHPQIDSEVISATVTNDTEEQPDFDSEPINEIEIDRATFNTILLHAEKISNGQVDFVPILQRELNGLAQTAPVVVPVVDLCDRVQDFVSQLPLIIRDDDCRYRLIKLAENSFELDLIAVPAVSDDSDIAGKKNKLANAAASRQQKI